MAANRTSIDPEVVYRVFIILVKALLRALIGYVVAFALDVTVLVMILGSYLEAQSSRRVVESIGDKSLLIVPVLGALLGILIRTEKAVTRMLLIVPGIVLGAIAGVFLGAFLTGLSAGIPRSLPSILVLFGTGLGGCLGNLVFSRSAYARNIEVAEADPEDSPLWDRELDG